VNQTDLFDLVRRADPRTSYESAELIMPKLNDLEQKVLAAMQVMARPVTDLDIITYCNAIYGERAESTYRHRRSDLAAKGLVRDTGETKWQQGRNRILWALK
jgi:hypothetical protein